MKGILLIALGHPNYGNMAFNLAVSLKNLSPEIPVALVHNHESIKYLKHRPLERFFDFLIEAPPESYIRNRNVEYIKAKTWMYHLSPFDETLFLDVDTIWLMHKPVTALFDILAGASLTFQNRGFMDMEKAESHEDYSPWCNLRELKETYHLSTGKFYFLSSEMAYFEKNKENRRFFSLARKIFDNPKTSARAFAGSVPDELAFSIAFLLLRRHPHASPFLPLYWEFAEKKYLRPHQLTSYYGYSAGGNRLNDILKENYDNLARQHFQKAGLQYPFLLMHKRLYLPERNKI